MTSMLISQEAGQGVWYSHIFQNFPQFIVIHTVKGFSTSKIHLMMIIAGLEEAQAGIKIAGRNINNFRYADNTTLMAES